MYSNINEHTSIVKILTENPIFFWAFVPFTLRRTSLLVLTSGIPLLCSTANLIWWSSFGPLLHNFTINEEHMYISTRQNHVKTMLKFVKKIFNFHSWSVLKYQNSLHMIFFKMSLFIVVVYVMNLHTFNYKFLSLKWWIFDPFFRQHVNVQS